MSPPPASRNKSSPSYPKPPPRPSASPPRGSNTPLISNTRYWFCLFLIFLEMQLWNMHSLCLTSLVQYFVWKIHPCCLGELLFIYFRCCRIFHRLTILTIYRTLLDKRVDCLQSLALTNNAAMHILVCVFGGGTYVYAFLLSIDPGVA